jgi:hypothetical protein
VTFKRGESYLVYADSTSITRRFRTEQCMMTRELIQALSDIEHFGAAGLPSRLPPN